MGPRGARNFVGTATVAQSHWVPNVHQTLHRSHVTLVQSLGGGDIQGTFFRETKVLRGQKRAPGPVVEFVLSDSKALVFLVNSRLLRRGGASHTCKQRGTSEGSAEAGCSKGTAAG